MKSNHKSLRGIGAWSLLIFISLGFQMLRAEDVPPGKSFLIDFGATARKSPEAVDVSKGIDSVWNNLTSGKVGDGLIGLKDEKGVSSKINLTITDSFWQENTTPWNEKGTQSSTVYPATATIDSFFIGTIYGHTEESAAMRFENLTKGAVYSVRIYASRMTEDLESDRTTLYTINNETKSLQVRNNVDNYVEFAGIVPNNQTIDIGVTMAQNAIFGYVGAIELIETLPPSIIITEPKAVSSSSDISYTAPANITIAANASDKDGKVTQVAFYANNSLLSVQTKGPYKYTWSNVPVGTYDFKAVATDDSNLQTTSKTVRVTVKPKPNVPPTVSAGNDQTIVLPKNTATLSGSASDSDGSIQSYQWSQVSGQTVTILNSTSSIASLSSFSTPGSYVFKLEVTDNSGAKASATTQVSVEQAPNVLPSSNAGADQTIKLPTNSVTLSGSGTDSDGSIVAYKWTGNGGTIVSPTSASTKVSGLKVGTYTYTLEVTDDRGGKATDSVNVVVNLADNVLPSSNAGADQTIKLPTNSVTLSGSGTDSDGTIVSYHWTGNGGTIVNPNGATTSITGFKNPGSFTYILQVTDDRGGSSSDSVVVNVLPANLAPTVNAGSDLVITLPTNSVSLQGTASDSDGTIATYSWTQVSGAATQIANASKAQASVSSLTAGVYVYQLEVTDNEGAKSSDQVSITVKAAPTGKLAVDAGGNQSFNQPANYASMSATLSGSVNLPKGAKIQSYTWTQISGPKATIVSPSSAKTLVTGLTDGTSVFQFEARDDQGRVGTDKTQVYINYESNVRVYDTGYNIKRTDGYVEYLPNGYTSKSKWPLIIFLHGVGEETQRDANGKSKNLLIVGDNGPLHFARTKDDQGKLHNLPFIVLSPQSTTWWSAADLDQFRQDVIKKYKVDQTRIYITGLSMGGGGVHDYLSTHTTTVSGQTVKLDYSKYIAAAITDAPAGVLSEPDAEKIIASKVALWNFHAVNDDTVKPYKSTLFTFDHIRTALGGKTPFTLPTMDVNSPALPSYAATTAYYDEAQKGFVWVDGKSPPTTVPNYYCTFWNNGKHGHWERVYLNPDIYTWLLQHHK